MLIVPKQYPAQSKFGFDQNLWPFKKITVHFLTREYAYLPLCLQHLNCISAVGEPLLLLYSSLSG